MPKPFAELRLTQALHPLKAYVKYLLIFSVFFNLLLFTPTFYMLNVLDHAIGDRSQETLLMLTIIMVFLFIGLLFLTWVRELLIQRASARFYTIAAPTVFDISARQALYNPVASAHSRAMADLQGIKRFIGHRSVLVFFDLPFTPLFLAVMFLFHVYFGLMVIFGIAVTVLVGYLEERHNKTVVKHAQSKFATADGFMSRNLNNAEVIHSMGMLDSVRSVWQRSSEQGLALQVAAGEREAGYFSISSTTRVLVSSLVLGTGAYLVINDEITRGLMIAAMVLSSRVLSPISMFVSTLGNFQIVRDQWTRLSEFFELTTDTAETTSLPAPLGKLNVETALVAPPGISEPVLRGISFSLQAGSHLGVMGPSGAGKSTLARAALGLWPCAKGSIRLDGADIFQWNRDELGPYIGYLPQDVELLDGTISDNIARLSEWQSEDVIEAATMAGVHELVLSLPQGYDTTISPRGGLLSGGQLQRIGLARALYGKPRFVVLDEPNTNLDQAGESALINALAHLKAAGTTVILIAHNQKMLAAMDNIMLLREGRIADFGQSAQILAKYQHKPQRPAAAGTDSGNDSGDTNGNKKADEATGDDAP